MVCFQPIFNDFSCFIDHFHCSDSLLHFPFVLHFGIRYYPSTILSINLFWLFSVLSITFFCLCNVLTLHIVSVVVVYGINQDLIVSLLDISIFRIRLFLISILDVSIFII